MNYSKLTFDDDKLDRKTFVINIMKIITTWNEVFPSSDSLVLALNSNWGSGKSYLMNMWKNWLLSSENESNNYAVAYFNAWENDDHENPFIPLAYSLREINIYGNDEYSREAVTENAKIFIRSCGIALLKDGIKKFVGEETSKIISEGLDSLKDVEVESFFEKYQEYINQKKVFSDALENLIPTDGKLIVMIDELDRCRPVFAVETLEIIKHFFNRKDVVFILALDIEQLSHSISTLYGANMDSNGYLRRFFDVTMNIPPGNIKWFLTVKYEKQFTSLRFSTSVIDLIYSQYSSFHLTLRDIEKITHNFIVFCMYYEKNFRPDYSTYENTLEFYLYFIILKNKHPDIYRMILRNGFTTSDNKQVNYPLINRKYLTSTYVIEFLYDFQNANLQNDLSLNEKYGFTRVNNRNIPLSENIEQSIELFI